MPAKSSSKVKFVPLVNKAGQVQAIMGVSKKQKGKGGKMAGNGGYKGIVSGRGSAGLLNFTW